jgi:hypothetical protein
LNLALGVLDGVNQRMNVVVAKAIRVLVCVIDCLSDLVSLLSCIFVFRLNVSQVFLNLGGLLLQLPEFQHERLIILAFVVFGVLDLCTGQAFLSLPSSGHQCRQ